jgi:hypothetical protein
MRRVSQDGSGLAGIAIDEDECGTLDAVVPFPIDREGDIGLFDMDGFGLQAQRELYWSQSRTPGDQPSRWPSLEIAHFPFLPNGNRPILLGSFSFSARHLNAHRRTPQGAPDAILHGVLGALQ